MDRDVYAKLLENLADLKDMITGMSGDVSDLETAVSGLETTVGTNSENITGLQTLIATKLTPIVFTGTVPAADACSVEVGSLSDLYGWQWLVETASGIWTSVNQVTYYRESDDSIFLYLDGDSASYRGKDYKLIVYKLAQPTVEG